MAATTAMKSPSWAQLLGSDNWKGLLDPLDPSLCSLVLHCGDMCQVTYDSFISDVHSKYCGASRYGRRSLLSSTHFPSADRFLVSDFLYATSELDDDSPLLLFSLSREAWSKESNWIGYVAVSSDSLSLSSGRHEIYVAWRGTIRDLEWVDVLRPELVSIDSLLSTPDDREPKVMKGWHTIYTSSDARSPFTKTSARDQLRAAVARLVERYKDESLSIVCVGHSLGASLAVLSAFDLVESGLAKGFPVCAVVFGSPQVGNKAFDERLRSHPNLAVLHVKNKIDLIPLYPTGLLGYVFSGTELVVDTRKSPYLKDSKNPSDWHNLQAILHSVAGWNGDHGEFAMKVKRSVALVNKSCEYLKDECLIPGSWWVEKNRGMVIGADREWGLAPPSDDDLPGAPYLTDGTGVDPKAAAEKPANASSGMNKLASCFCGVI